MNRLLTVVLVLMTVAGCASWRTREPVPPPPRETWHGPLAMIAFADPTDPVRGEQLAARFWSEAEPRLATAISAVIRRTGPRLAASWLKERATAYRVGAFVTGRIGGVRVQTREHRLWMSLTVYLVAADGSRLLWSRRLAETEPLTASDTAEEATDRLIRRLAREFVHACPTPS